MTNRYGPAVAAVLPILLGSSAVAHAQTPEPTSVLTRMVQDVAKDHNGIGYAGFHNHQPGTHPIQIADTAADPFYEGTFDEVRSAVYPLTRVVYIYLDRPPDRPLDPPIRTFLSCNLSLEGQRNARVEEEGIFMPLPPRIAARQRAKLEWLMNSRSTHSPRRKS